MKFLIYIILFFSILSGMNAQYWEKINTLPPIYRDGYYLDIYFLPGNSNYVWACGFDGFVVRSTNYGVSWQGTAVPNPAYHLENIQFISTSVGFVSGVEGIWKSSDGGASFTDITPVDSSGRGFWGCYFLDANVGVVVGGGCDDLQRFYKTTDGGANWTLFQTSVLSSGLTDLILYPNGTGYAVSSGYIWYTTNTGSTWTVTKTTPTPYWQEEISRINNSFLVPVAGFTCSGGGGGGGMNFTTDGGNNWKTYNAVYPMFGACLTSETTGWACGYARSVYYTSNSGQSWQIRNCGIQNVDLDDITFLTPTDGWVCGQGIYKLSPTKILTSKDSLGFGEICFPDTRRDSLKIINLSFFPADLQVSIINDFDNAFSVLSPSFNSQIFDCDSNVIVVKFSPPANNIYTAKLRLSAISGDGTTTFVKEIPLVGTGNKSTIRAENKQMVFDSIPCNLSRNVDLKWFSDNNSEQIKSYFELKDDKSQITFQTNLPVWVTRGGTSTQFQLLLKDTGWVTQDYRFLFWPCNTDTIITISAYGVSPIIHSIDSLHFISHCKGDVIDTIPVWNTGNATLTITKSSIVGNPPEVQILGWTSKKTEPISIPKKSADSVIIKFNPQSLSNSNYYLNLVNDDVTLTRGNQNPKKILLLGRKESELVEIKDTVIDFNKICINSYKDSAITFENIGNIQALMELENQPKNPFSVNTPWKLSINPKEKGYITAKFSPTSKGIFSDTLLFKTGDCNYLRIYLKGIGIESKLEGSPASILGTLKSGESKNYSIQLKNTGNTSLNIFNYRLVPPTTDFTYALAPKLTQTLDTGQQIDFTLSVLSNKTAYYKGQICFDASGLCITEICFPVEFISIDRYLSMIDTINFGISKCSALKFDTIWVKNAGAEADTIESYDLTGSSAFSISGIINSPNSIPEGDSLGFIIKFESLIEGVFSSTLTVKSKNPDGQTLTTNIKAEFKKSEFTISKSFIDFGTFEKCDKDTTIAFNIENLGLLEDNLISYSNKITGGFSSSNFSPILFQGKEKSNFSITFTPAKSSNIGLIQGYIYWYSATCNDTIKIDFQANIIEPKLTYSSLSVDFGSVWINDSKNDGIKITNNSTVPRTIKSIKALSVPYFKVLTTLPITINPTEIIDITFSYSPIVTGNFIDSMIIEEFSVCADTFKITLTGQTPSEEYSANIVVGNYTADPGDTIFVELTLNPKLDRIDADSIQLQLSFDKYLIYPVQMLLQSTLGNFSNHEFIYSSGVLSASFNKDEAKSIFENGDTIIKIKSLILASTPGFTPIHIDKFNVETQKNLVIIKKDGSLELSPICDPEVEHHLIVYPTAGFSIISSPAESGEAVLKFENIQDGTILEVYNYLGIKVSDYILEKGSYNKKIDFTKFSQGVYFLYLRPGTDFPKKLINQN